MSFNFDQEISREHTDALKYEGRAAYFGTQNVQPMWVADMDFSAPPAVTAALLVRAAHPIYGYSVYPESLYVALQNWLKNRHKFEVPREDIMLVAGVVPSLFASVQAFSNKGDAVIVQPPVYAPFFSAVTTAQRVVLENPLRLTAGRYEIDFEHLEQCAAHAKMLLLCSPHNPVGRVWTDAELREILRITRRHNVLVVSDEIHADLIYAGARHTMLAKLASDSDQIITAVAPSKTFNLPGLGLSALIVRNPEHRAALQKVFDSLHLGSVNPFSAVAFEVAYREGGAWLDSLLEYLAGNQDFVREFLQIHLPKIKLIESEGTYLLWLDCRELNLRDAALRDFFVQHAQLGMNAGISFGEGGSGFMRLNIAAPRTKIAAALQRVQAAFFSGNCEFSTEGSRN